MQHYVIDACVYADKQVDTLGRYIPGVSNLEDTAKRVVVKPEAL